MSDCGGERPSEEAQHITDADTPITKKTPSSSADLNNACAAEVEVEAQREETPTYATLESVPKKHAAKKDCNAGPSGYVASPPNNNESSEEHSESSDEEDPKTSQARPQNQQIEADERQQEILSRYLNRELTFSEYAQLAAGETEVDETVGDCQSAAPDSPVNTSAQADALMEEMMAARGKGARRRRRILPPALQGLMGEANLRYARGDHVTAERMCLEIIRQCPKDPEAFNTLAHLYEEQGLPEKSLQVALIAALLSPGDPNQWIRLAVMSEEQGNLKQAIQCYTRAIRADPANIECHMKRATLLEQSNDFKTATKCYNRLLNVLQPDEGPLILDLAKKIASSYHEEGDAQRAREAMEVAFAKVPDQVQLEDVNLLLDLLIQLQDFQRCVEIMVSYCGVEVEYETNKAGEALITMCQFPEEIPMDLWAKLAVVLIRLHTLHMIDDLIEFLLQRVDCEMAGDLFLDVAEALMAIDHHEDALRLLQPLVDSTNYSLAAVWLRQGECFRKCGRMREAVESYEQVVEQAPQQVEVRVTLASLLTGLGREEEALSVLTQDEDSEVLDPGMLYRRAILLQEGGLERCDEFLAVGQLLLSRHCVRIRNREELDALCRLRRIDKKSIALKEIRFSRGEAQIDQDAPEFGSSDRALSVEEEWNLLISMCEVCLCQGRMGLLQRLAFSALGSKRFYTDYGGKAAQVEFLSLLACLHNSDAYYGYNLARDLAVREIKLPRVWNLFNLVIQRADDVRHNRFIMRLLSHHPTHPALTTLHANNCLVAGTYKYALNEYANAFRRDETPMLAFLIGVTLIQMACQKFSAKKHALVSQGIAFLWQYKDLRGPYGLQEVYYNVGRAFHQLGLLPAAIHHYKLVLDFDSPLIEEEPMLDLKQEAAFNLHLIYMSTGCRDLAQMYIDKYIIT